MTDQRNTGRRPNIHSYLSRWIESGFADELVAAIQRVKETGEDELFSLYLPGPHLHAWSKLVHEKVPAFVLERCKADIADNPLEWTIRKNDAERTMVATQEDQSHTCPPDCS